MHMETPKTKSKNLIPKANTYIVRFRAGSQNVDNFEEICKCLYKYEKLAADSIKKVREIKSDIYSATVFTTNVPLNKTIQRMKDAIGFYQVYLIKRENMTSPKFAEGNNHEKIDDSFIPHSWTGVKRVHDLFKNYGKGVRVSLNKSIE